MSSLNMQFDPTKVDPNQPEPVPVGDYLMQAIESKVAPTKKGTGTMLNLTFDILEGPYKGRRVYENINVTNDSPAAQQIGQKQLSALCHAAGLLTAVTNSEQLHYKPFLATIGIQAAEGQYAAKNVVQKYIFGKTAAQTAGTQSQAPGQGPAQGSAWTEKQKAEVPF